MEERHSRYNSHLQETAKNDRLMRYSNRREEYQQRNLNIVRNKDKITLTINSGEFNQFTPQKIKKINKITSCTLYERGIKVGDHNDEMMIDENALIDNQEEINEIPQSNDNNLNTQSLPVIKEEKDKSIERNGSKRRNESKKSKMENEPGESEGLRKPETRRSKNGQGILFKRKSL